MVKVFINMMNKIEGTILIVPFKIFIDNLEIIKIIMYFT